MDQQNIRVIFTAKANSALEDLINNFKLQETPEDYVEKNKQNKPSNIVVMDRLARDFAVNEISETNLVASLQKELGVSQQTAEKISEEVISKIIPFLEKVPEEKLEDDVFVEELSKKISGTTASESREKNPEKKDTDIFPNIKPPTNFIEQNVPLLVKRVRGKSTLPSKKLEKTFTEKSVPQTRQSNGPDNYREPI